MRPPNEGSPPAVHQGGFPRKSTNPTDTDTIPPTGDSLPVVTSRFVWERAIRRIEMHPTRKLIAMMLATYANKDGTNAHPGETRLAADCCIDVRSVRRHLAALRDLGLIVRTTVASTKGKRGVADSYDLTVPPSSTNHRTPVTGASATNHRTPVTETTGHPCPPTNKRTPSKRTPTRSVLTVRSVTADTEPMEDAATRTDQRKPRLSTNARLSTPTEPDDGPIPLADALAELKTSDRASMSEYCRRVLKENGRPPDPKRRGP
jgi:hypothetical protein